MAVETKDTYLHKELFYDAAVEIESLGEKLLYPGR
jgi:hypothetical protein